MYTDFSDIVDDVIDNVHLAAVSNVYDLNLTDVAKAKSDFPSLRPLPKKTDNVFVLVLFALF
jgi:hypothetical protein